jgi:hypothetical protein
MRITVRQLKGLIREAVEDAMVDGDGVAPRGVSPSVQAKLERLAEKYKKYFYTENPVYFLQDPANVLHDIADEVADLPGAKSLEGLFAHVDIVVNLLKKTLPAQTFKEVKDSVAQFRDEKESERYDDDLDDPEAPKHAYKRD